MSEANETVSASSNRCPGVFWGQQPQQEYRLALGIESGKEISIVGSRPLPKASFPLSLALDFNGFSRGEPSTGFPPFPDFEPAPFSENGFVIPLPIPFHGDSVQYWNRTILINCSVLFRMRSTEDGNRRFPEPIHGSNRVSPIYEVALPSPSSGWIPALSDSIGEGFENRSRNPERSCLRSSGRSMGTLLEPQSSLNHFRLTGYGARKDGFPRRHPPAWFRQARSRIAPMGGSI